jgi:hypothetical protein
LESEASDACLARSLGSWCLARGTRTSGTPPRARPLSHVEVPRTHAAGERPIEMMQEAGQSNLHDRQREVDVREANSMRPISHRELGLVLFM